MKAVKILVKLLFLIFELLAVYYVFGQQQPFMAQYSKGLWIFATDAVQIHDGGFLIVGEVKDSAGADSDILLAKTDNNGLIKWSKAYAGNGDEFPSEIIATTDSNYIITGYSNSFNNSNDIFVIKVDSAGGKIWDKVYGKPLQGEYAQDIVEDKNGNLFIAGNAWSTNNNNNDGFLMKLSPDGTQQWFKGYEGGGAEDIFAMAIDSAGFILAGSTQILVGNDDGYVIRTDTAGNVLWAKYMSAADVDQFTKVRILPSGGFVISGSTTSAGAGIIEGVVVNLTANGSIDRAYTYGTPDWDAVYDLQILENGEILLLLESGSQFNFIKLKEDGDYYWSKKAGVEDLFERPQSLIITTEGDYVAVGVTKNAFGDSSALLIARIDTAAQGCSEIEDEQTSIGAITFQNADLSITMIDTALLPDTSGFEVSDVVLEKQYYCSGVYESLDERPDLFALEIFPNPAGSHFFLRSPLFTGKRIVVQVFSADGREVFGKDFYNPAYMVKVDLPTVQTGIYFMKIKTGHKVLHDKILISN